MLGSHSQFVRACRAFGMAATMALLPQGAAWAGQDVWMGAAPSGTYVTSFPYPITVNVTPVEATPFSPTGTVQFRNVDVPGTLGSANLENGLAHFSFQDRMLVPSTNYIYIDYSGDGCFNPLTTGPWLWFYEPGTAAPGQARAKPDTAPARSGAARAALPERRATRTALTPLPPNPSLAQLVELSANVIDCQGSPLSPDGNVTFLETSTQRVLGTEKVSKNLANLTLPADDLGIGSHSVTAKFTSTSMFFADSSGSATVTVTPSHPAKAKTKGKVISPPRAYRSGRSRELPRRDRRPQAPPGKGRR